MWNNFLISLAIMGKGMAGIFVVVLIITAVVLILGKLEKVSFFFLSVLCSSLTFDRGKSIIETLFVRV